MKKYKILVTYVEAGMGHIISAEAIANALETYYPDEVEVERCYVFSEGNDPDLKKHEEWLIHEVKFGNRHRTHFWFLDFLQTVFPSQVTLAMAYAMPFRRVRRALMRLFAEKKPDMVFNTHFTPQHCARIAKRKIGLDFLVTLYDPDPNVHGWWDSRSDLAMFNNEGAYREATEERGFLPERCLSSRFVLRNVVRDTPRDKVLLRQKHGLPTDNFTVVMADGAYAEANLCPFAEELLKLDRRFTLLIIAGKNEEVYERFSSLIGHTGNIDLHVYRFMPDVHELYGAADLFVTKAGPNAILDSVAMGTPVMTTYYSSPIECVTNELYVTRHRCGVYTSHAKEGAELIQGYIDDPTLLAPYVEGCRVFLESCVGGEKEMADALIALLREREKSQNK